MKRYVDENTATVRDDRFRRSLVWSTGLHGMLAVAIVVAPSSGILGDSGETWGDQDGLIRVGLSGGSSGIPLPTSPNATPDGAGTESESIYEEVAPPPAPEPPAPETVAEAVPIPVDPQPDAAPPEPEPEPAPVAPPRPPDPEPAPAPPEPPAPTPSRTAEASENRPENAVGFGTDRNRVALPTGQGGEGGGAGMDGGGVFGTRFGTYVEGMQRRISQNWLQANIDSSIRSAPRVYLTFRIDRSGRISNIVVDQSSGNVQVDRSAQRALAASSPLQELPREYEGRYVDVRFWFELRR